METVATWTRLSVTLYVHCLIFFWAQKPSKFFYQNVTCYCARHILIMVTAFDICNAVQQLQIETHANLNNFVTVIAVPFQLKLLLNLKAWFSPRTKWWKNWKTNVTHSQRSWRNPPPDTSKQPLYVLQWWALLSFWTQNGGVVLYVETVN